jgi:amidase
MNGDAFTLNAVELADAIAKGERSSSEAVASCLAQIKAHDRRLKAFVTVTDEAALQQAEQADRVRAQGNRLPPLHGVPVAIKDLTRTNDVRTTYGSTRFGNFVPDEDEECVARLRRAGAIVLGKTNTPEFGFGAICSNGLLGPTANPWNERLTSGGSSGGSAVAVTTGMAPLAHGTDFGGSVRTPASFCGCVGLRPTPGLIPDPTRSLAWNTLNTHGAMARCVGDAALMLRAMAGPHDMDPTSLVAMGWQAASGHASSGARQIKVAVSATLGGSFAVEPQVRYAFERAVIDLGPHFDILKRGHPDCSEAVDAFKTLRAAVSWHNFHELIEAGEDDLEKSFVWNVTLGREVSGERFLAAEAARARVYRAFAEFFRDNDVLVLPAASVLPFPNEQEDVWSIGDVACETIIDYLAPTFIISLVGFPSICLPAAWTDDGKPFGVQLVGRPYDEATLLRAAAHIEVEADFRHRWPPI